MMNRIDELVGVKEGEAMTNREAHEQAAGMPLDDIFFKVNLIDGIRINFCPICGREFKNDI